MVTELPDINYQKKEASGTFCQAKKYAQILE